MQDILILPETLYFILLLCGWIAAMFSGIAFVYGIQMKKESRVLLLWGGAFALCLLLLYLLMHGVIAAA